MYAKIKNDTLQVGLPKKGTLSDGSTVMGYDKLPEEILTQEGWHPYQEAKPDHDPNTHYLIRGDYHFEDGKIVQNYATAELPPATEHDEYVDPEQRIAELEQAIAELSLVLGGQQS